MPKASRKSPKKRKRDGVDGRSTQAKITPLYESTEINVKCPICPATSVATPFELSKHMLAEHTVKNRSLGRCGWLGCGQTAMMISINLLDHYNRHTGGRHTCGYPIPDPDDPAKTKPCEELCKDRRGLCEHRGLMHQNRARTDQAIAESSRSARSVARKPPERRDTQSKRAPYRPQEKHSGKKSSHKAPVPVRPAPVIVRRRESPLPDAHFVKRMARLGLRSPATMCAPPLSRRSSNATLYDGGAPVGGSGKTRLRDEITYLCDDSDEDLETAAEDGESVGDGYRSEDEVDELLSSDFDPPSYDDPDAPRHGIARGLPDTDAPMKSQDAQAEEEEIFVYDSDGDEDFEEYQANHDKGKSAMFDLEFDEAAVLPSLEEDWKSFE